ncbi:MAG: YwbE family protein [Clostridiales bacterium]|nr:YwbE family protein [Clostridiales bacterium]
MYLDVDVTIKDNICIGLVVDIVEDKNKSSQIITQGCVKRIISNKDCKKGIKVELTNGAIGHIKGIPSKNDIKKETFKFYNIFFYQEYIYSIWDKKNNKFLVLNRLNKLKNKVEKTILLFSSNEIANEKIKGTSLDNKNFSIRSIRRKNKTINNFFKNYEVDYYSIDTTRKLSKEKMEEYEKRFKSF